MQEFSSISVSSYEAGSLAERLTEQSRDGWQVVAIVPTGNTVTAYLGRDTDASATPPMPAATSDAAADTEPDTTADEASLESLVAAVAITPEPAPEPAGDASDAAGADAADGPAPVDTVADIAPEPVDATATADTTSAPGAAPAGWYADPSGRFELRYWDGGQWTEHVSRAGQQYTDPPVA